MDQGAEVEVSFIPQVADGQDVQAVLASGDHVTVAPTGHVLHTIEAPPPHGSNTVASAAADICAQLQTKKWLQLPLTYTAGVNSARGEHGIRADSEVFVRVWPAPYHTTSPFVYDFTVGKRVGLSMYEVQSELGIRANADGARGRAALLVEGETFNVHGVALGEVMQRAGIKPLRGGDKHITDMVCHGTAGASSSKRRC